MLVTTKKTRRIQAINLICFSISHETVSTRGFPEVFYDVISKIRIFVRWGTFVDK